MEVTRSTNEHGVDVVTVTYTDDEKSAIAERLAAARAKTEAAKAAAKAKAEATKAKAEAAKAARKNPE